MSERNEVTKMKMREKQMQKRRKGDEERYERRREERWGEGMYG